MVADIIFWVVITFFLLAIVGTPIVLFLQIIFAFLKYFLSDWYNRHLFFTRLDESRIVFLQKNFVYYQRLNDQDKETFGRRVQKFIDMKTFEGRQDLIVTEEMETLVAAAAIQITFGYPSVYFRRFHTIILYPEAYLSTITGNYHRGEVFSGGIIVLSWKNLTDGYLNNSDGRNLGLHEMAHALKLTDAYTGEDRDFLQQSDIINFTALAREEMNRIALGEPSFFRSYAATNDQEFFAVAVENFFEKPEEFRYAHADLYDSLVTLLRQNPLILARGLNQFKTQAA
jgi:MtfA peptidase